MKKRDMSQEQSKNLREEAKKRNSRLVGVADTSKKLAN